MENNTTPNDRHTVKAVSPSHWSEVLDGHRAHQRDQILAAALDLLGEKGMAALTMSAVAERAGMSRATLYHYFSDVDAVLAAWVGREIERSVAAMVTGAQGISDPIDRLGYLVEIQARTFASQRHRLSAEHFESEAGSPAVRREVEARMAPLRRLLADTVVEAQARGRIDPGVAPELAADLVLGLLGAVRRHLTSGRISPEEAIPAVMELLGSGWFRLPS
jgi:AcrR family transcriptional regulator